MNLAGTQRDPQEFDMPLHACKVALAAWVLPLTMACMIDYYTESPSAHERAVQLEIEAQRGWTDTGMDLQPGDEVIIAYISGEWSPWAGGYYDALGSGGDPRCDCNVLAGVSHAALIGRVGDADPFLVGARFDQTVGQGGRLWLGINDTRLDDNGGALIVRIELR
ncbi:MAG: hypothetical protein MUO35_04840 [Anaerolineales bacterium]|nr:hypothetical protein [Anaerolineales bacterium]